MPFDGYLEVGGREIVNSARTFHYVSTLAPAFGLRACQDCDDLGDALGETYTTPEGDDAPWFDQSDPETGLFYGLYPLAIEGLSSSTRESTNVELVGNGSVQTSQRRAGRDLMVRGLMFGATREALDRGFSWLDNTLNSDECDGERARIFSACPEVVDYPPEAFEPVDVGERGELLRTNLAQNPSFSTSDGDFATPIARVNLSETPNYSDGVMDQQDGTFTVLDGQIAGSGDMVGVEYRRANIGTPNTVSPISFTDDNLATATAATAGNTYTLSAFAFQSAVMYDDIRLDVEWIDGADAVIQTDAGSLMPLPEDVWTRTDQTLVAPVNTARVRTVMNFTGTGGIASEFVGVGGLLIEETDTLKPLIVGDISRDANLEASFSGADYDSTTEAFAAGLFYPTAESLLSQDGQSDVGDADQPHAFYLQAVGSEFASGGVWSGCVVSDGDGDTDVYANVTETGTADRYLIAGRTYRISADVHVERAHVGPFNPDANRLRSIAIVGRNASDNADIIIATSGSGVNADETTTRVSLTVAMNPAAITGIGGYIRLYNGSSSVDEPVWWDQLIIEDVTDDVPVDDSYFDGGTTHTASFNYYWSGTPGASTSSQHAAVDYTAEAALWQTTSGTITGDGLSFFGEGVAFNWDSEDAQQIAWRSVSGLIPGENYQVRLRGFGNSFRVQVGNEEVTPDTNFAKNPRWLGSEFDGTLVSPAPASNMFDEEDGGPLGLGWRRYVYPSDTAADTVTVTDVVDQDRMTELLELNDVTVSAYAYASAGAAVSLVVRYFFEGGGGQVGPDEVLDTAASDGDWVQLSGPATMPLNATLMQIEIQYATSGPIASGSEFGAWGSMVSPTTSTTYFDGYTDGYVWTGTPDFSTSVADADVEWTTYSNRSPEDWDIPFEPTVLDFIPRDSEVTLYIGGEGNLLLDAIKVIRVPNPGVVAFSTNHLDMVPASDGWQHDPVTGALIEMDIVEVQGSVRYQGHLSIQIEAPFEGGVTVDATDGPYRSTFGLKPGTRYRLGINYGIDYPGDPVPAEPTIEGVISQTVVYSAEGLNLDATRSYRAIEFVPEGSTITVRLEPTQQVNLGSQESLDWTIEEVLVEEIFDDADTSQPDPLKNVSRTMYGVTAITGPEMTNLRRTSCGWMGQVTFGLRSGNPGVFREPLLAGGLPTSVSTAVNVLPCVDGQEARVNFMYNPSVETAVNPVGGRTDYEVSAGVLTRENGATPGPVVGSWFAQGAGSDSIRGIYTPGDAVDGPTPVSGGTYTVSVFVAADATGTYQWQRELDFIGGSTVLPDVVELTADVWTRIENTFTTPPGEELVEVAMLLFDEDELSGNLWMDGFMVEPGSSAGTVWDETFEGASWSGTAQESALLLSGADPDITVDPDCPVVPLPPAPPVVDVSCVDEPEAYERSVITIPQNTVPESLTAFPVLTLLAGAQDVRQARIRFWENPDHLTIDELDQCQFDGDIIVSFIPAGATLVIDGVQRIATMTLNGVTQDATHLLYGADGAPVDWPELTGGIEYLVTLDLDFEGAFSDTQMTVELVVRD